MKTEQRRFTPAHGWTPHTGGLGRLPPQLVLVWGSRFALAEPRLLPSLREAYPGARLVLASTAGEIADTGVGTGQVIATAIACEATHVGLATTQVRSQFDSHAAGTLLAERLRGPDLVHVFVVSDGQLVNGTALALGLNEKLGPHVTVSGGLAGDDERFEETTVGLDEPATPGRIVAIGFYSRRLQIGLGSCGGWTPAGAEQTVTAAEGNILFALDGQPALDLYRRYLGEQAAGLPASALRFPLYVLPPGGRPAIVRTILAVEPSTHSMVFAGDIPTGSTVRFMHATAADLIAGAAQAAATAALAPATDLALCVSCVGRRLVLGARTGEELAAVRTTLGPGPLLAGFYSYGELAPAEAGHGCQLHNQTMTITTFRET